MLIAMACHSTVENKRTDLSVKTILALFGQLRVEFDSLYVILNGCDEESEAEIIRASRTIGSGYVNKLNVFTLVSRRNIGTAEAINWGWSHRVPGQVLCKLDDDTLIYDDDWTRKMEEAILISMQRGTAPDIGSAYAKDRRGPRTPLGILGLKRRDLAEHPNAEGSYKSVINYLPHQPGEHWIPVEFVQENVMGTVTAYNPNLIDKIGGLYQMQDIGNLYGFDDSFASQRAYLAGYARGFLVGVDIEHIDPGGTAYSGRKMENAGRFLADQRRVSQEYASGKRSLYYPIHAPESQGAS